MKDWSEETTLLYNEKYRCLNCTKRKHTCAEIDIKKNDNGYCENICIKTDFKYKT